MRITQVTNQTYKDLQALLRLSIAGIFIFGGLGYVFNGLIGSLEQETKNTQLKLDITKKAEVSTQEAKYNFEKSLSLLDENGYAKYKLTTIKKVDKSDEYITILKYGGKIDIGLNNESKRYEPLNEQSTDSLLTGNGIYTDIKKSFLTLDTIMSDRKNTINDKNIESFLQTQNHIAEEAVRVRML
ncbi:MAG TPA: hypothetical protein EYG95_05675, partial [Campylobacterales bacterium]|nr:hypothetical protein [Campylobacterales bacterium]